jgi:hypothetical protein
VVDPPLSVYPQQPAVERPSHGPCTLDRSSVVSFEFVHPIEMLRAVARSRGGDPGQIGAEAAWCLAALAAEDPAAVLPACRRLLERHPGCGPLWWVSARVLVAGDPVAEAESCAALLLDDRTDRSVRSALRSGQGSPPRRAVRSGGIAEVASAEVVLVEVNAIGESEMLVPASRSSLLRAAEVAGTPLWVESGVGRFLPPKLWGALLDRLGTKTRSGHGVVESSTDVVESLDRVELVIGPEGAGPVADPGSWADEDRCPEPPELTSGW